MEIVLKLNSQQKISALAELLMVAAKSPNVNEEGMKIALGLIDEMKHAVAVANGEAPGVNTLEEKEAA